ncbi:hypothetical protein LTR53_008097 [Teratosphaeriaceae sp. CCFEE 6253]|nr:hypothetical protein LTR53_008097 [Teratosphaeriaceae sp. CCFEE 6253]
MPQRAWSLLSRLTLGLSIAVGLYATLLGLLLTPSIQRFAVYANRINTLFLGDDLNKPEAFGFARHQVTPFNLRTPDGETLYGWHILPLDVYARHEKVLREEGRPPGPVDDLTQTSAFAFLTNEDPSPARVVITFHGNAGHVAQGWRTDTYRSFAAQPNTHVITIDYRGFGYSTGTPTEAGLIIDGTTLVDWVLRVAGIPSERIVIIGQSLGTAVSSAVALHFADPGSELIPLEVREAQPSLQRREPTVFAGVILVAPFSSLPSLMLTYRIGGLLPILLPLRPLPYVAGMLTDRMVDKWMSAERLAAYYRSSKGDTDLLSGPGGRSMGSLQLIHSIRDMDIPYHQTEMICRRMLGMGAEPGVYDGAGKELSNECLDGSHGAHSLDVNEIGAPRVRFELIEYGGHNRLVTYSQVGVAVRRAMEDLFM